VVLYIDTFWGQIVAVDACSPPQHKQAREPLKLDRRTKRKGQDYPLAQTYNHTVVYIELQLADPKLGLGLVPNVRK
jgi:hypothetical protein